MEVQKYQGSNLIAVLASSPGFSASFGDAGFFDISFLVTCHCLPSHTSSSSYSASGWHKQLNSTYCQIEHKPPNSLIQLFLPLFKKCTKVKYTE